MHSDMKRREFLRAAGSWLAGLGLATLTPSSARAVSRKKIDVLFIGCDDLQIQLGT